MVNTDTLVTTQQYTINQNIIYGIPPASKYQDISFGHDNNLEKKIKDHTDTWTTTKKIKIFESLSIGGNYNLAADSMKLSAFQLRGRTTLFDKIGVNFGGT